VPSRALLIVAGLLTQLLGAICLVLALASIPIVHDLQGGTKAALASVIAALAAMVCGTLVWRGRLIPLALAAGLDVGLGIVLPRGTSGIGALLRILPQGDVSTAETLVTIGAIGMFVAAVLCLVAIPSAIKLRRWARDELAKPDYVPEVRRPGSTLKGWGTMKLVPTQVLRAADAPARSKPAVIFAVAIPLIAVGIAVISASTGGASAKDDVTFGSAGSAPPKAAPVSPPVAPSVVVDAAAIDAAAAVEPPLEDFITLFHGALGAGDTGSLLDPKVFGFGIEAHEVAEGRADVAAMLAHDVGGKAEISAKLHQVGRDGDIAWVAEELHAGGKSFVVSYVAGLSNGAWMIAAIHFAVAMPNDIAYKLARDGDLAVPDAIPGQHDESALALAMKTAFASKSSFVDARSTRADAFNFGSAPGEHILGGDAIRKVFGRIRATVHLHDAVRVGAVGAHGGWGAANVDFTDADRDGTDVTQTFRVLAAWVQEDAGWRIVQTQWSNAR